VSEYQQINDGQWPVVASSEFSASVAVSSGETIVLGGLSQSSKDSARSKIPFLGDIPLIGLLFSSTDNKNQRKEILVFITPYVMDNPEDIELAARRTHSAMGTDARWKRGWSASKLGEENPVFQKAMDAEMARIAAATNQATNQPFSAPIAESNLLNDADTSVWEGNQNQGNAADKP
jgi:type II secretory pathway component GspD/PulD (secretin)